MNTGGLSVPSVEEKVYQVNAYDNISASSASVSVSVRTSGAETIAVFGDKWTVVAGHKRPNGEGTRDEARKLFL